MIRPPILFVGELNPYGPDPDCALYPDPPTSAGGRLCRLVCGLDEAAYMLLHRANLCDRKWSMRAARDRALLLRSRPRDWHVIVMLGAKVREAFGCGAWRPFEYGIGFDPGMTTVTLISLPHPSGLCREWSRPGSFERARRLLRDACPSVHWGERTVGGNRASPP